MSFFNNIFYFINLFILFFYLNCNIFSCCFKSDPGEIETKDLNKFIELNELNQFTLGSPFYYSLHKKDENTKVKDVKIKVKYNGDDKELKLKIDENILEGLRIIKITEKQYILFVLDKEIEKNFYFSKDYSQDTLSLDKNNVLSKDKIKKKDNKDNNDEIEREKYFLQIDSIEGLKIYKDPLKLEYFK